MQAREPGVMITLKRTDVLAGWIMAGIVSVLPIMFLMLGIGALAGGDSVGLWLLLFAAPGLALAALVIVEARSRAGVRIIVDANAVHLKLPQRRGYAAQDPVQESVPRASVSAVESRSEAFRSAGSTVVQRSFSLVLSDGRRIVLGGDRPMQPPFFEQAAGAISAQLRVPVRELGMVEGDPGFLLISGQRVPTWDTQPLNPTEADRRTAASAATWRIVFIIVGTSLVIGTAARLFG